MATRSYTKLTERQLRAIGRRFQGGESARSIAVSYGVSPATITKHAKDRGWIKGGHKVERAKRSDEKFLEKTADQRAERMVEYYEHGYAEVTRLRRFQAAVLGMMEFNAKLNMEAAEEERREIELETARLQAVENAKALAEGRDPEIIKPRRPKSIQLKDLPRQFRTITRAGVDIDKRSRLLLGLDGTIDPEQFKDDPAMDLFSTKMEEIRNELGVELEGA